MPILWPPCSSSSSSSSSSVVVMLYLIFLALWTYNPGNIEKNKFK